MQTTLTLLIAVVIGGPLGIACGRLAWHAFAGSLGVVPIVEVPVAALILGLAALYLGLHALTGQSSSAGDQVKHVTRIVPLPI